MLSTHTAVTRQSGQAALGEALQHRLAGASALALPDPHGSLREAVLGRPVSRTATLRILVVEDDAPTRHACAEIASSLNYGVETADSVATARAVLKRTSVDILLLDLKLPGGGGFTVLEEVRQHQPRIATVVMTAFASVSSAVEAMRTGAGDYLPKPFTLEELSAVLERAAERRTASDESRLLREKFRAGRVSGMLSGESPGMEKLFRMISKVAYTGHPVLILGESGTGKEMVGRSIHANGPHAAKPFIPVDCGSLVPAMMEGELFGYAKGFSPEGVAPRMGLLVAAGGGTVFLDEIADLALDLQGKLLRTLQDREVRPVGATSAVPLEARVLAGTGRDLPALVEGGKFRKDLYYRLNVVNVRIPPLRERAGDIPLLAAHILERVSQERGTAYTFSDEALRMMVDYEWPGNLRELEYTIERACALSSGPLVHLADLPAQMREPRLPGRLPRLHAATEPADPMEVVPIFELEKQAILNTLRQLNGDKLRAARLLGIGKTTLYRKLKEYGYQDDWVA